jgi:hypothetical protein
MSREPRFDTPAGLMAGDPALAELFHAARTHRALAATVAEHLPAELARHLRGAVLRGDELVLLTDGGAFATRLRFLEPALRQALHARHRVTVRRVSARVALDAPVTHAAVTPPTLTDAARRALESAAVSAATPALAAALRRLARR